MSKADPTCWAQGVSPKLSALASRKRRDAAKDDAQTHHDLHSPIFEGRSVLLTAQSDV